MQPVAVKGVGTASIGALSNQNKALVGGVGLLAAAAVAFALLHHPQPTTPPNMNPPSQNGQNGQNPTPPAPAPNGQTGQNGQNPTPPGQDGQNKAPAQNGLASNDGGTSHGNSATNQQTNSSSVMPAGTSVVVRLDSDFNSDNATVGELLPATVVSPLTSDGNVVVQRGASAQLKVVQIDKSGKISGKSRVQFALVGLTAHGKLMRISGSSKEVDGPSQGVRTAETNGHR